MQALVDTLGALQCARTHAHLEPADLCKGTLAVSIEACHLFLQDQLKVRVKLVFEEGEDRIIT